MLLNELLQILLENLRIIEFTERIIVLNAKQRYSVPIFAKSIHTKINNDYCAAKVSCLLNNRQK